MLSSFFVVLVLISPLPLLAKQKAWVKSPYSSSSDFQFFLKSSDPKNISYAKHQLKKQRDQSKAYQLKEKLILAQQFYLAGEKSKAQSAFLDISELAYLADWDKEDQRIFIYSFLRLAQMEEDAEKRSAFLILAHNFSGFLIDSKSYQDFDLFPPPLMKELEKIQKQSLKLSVDWNKIFPNHEIILLNGQRVEKNKPKQYFQTYYKITALSSSHELWSKKINLSEMLFKKINTDRLSYGSCENLKLIDSLDTQTFKLFQAPNCPKPNILNLEQQNIKMTHDPNKKSFEIIPSNIPSWLIIGAGVVALSLAISLSGDDGKEEPKEDHIF